MVQPYDHIKARLYPQRRPLGDLIERLHPHQPHDDPADTPPWFDAGSAPLMVGQRWNEWLAPRATGTFRFVAAVRLADTAMLWAGHHADSHEGLAEQCRAALAVVHAFERGDASSTDALLATERVQQPDRLPHAQWGWLVPQACVRHLFGGGLQMAHVAWAMQQWAQQVHTNVNEEFDAFLTRWWHAVRCSVAVKEAWRLTLETLDWREALESVGKHPNRLHKVQPFAANHGNGLAESLLDSALYAVRELGVIMLNGRLRRDTRARLERMARADRSAAVRKAARIRLGIG